MLDTVRKYVEAGREALTPKKAEDLARALVKQGQARADQAGRLARDLLEWSRKNSERLREAIRSEVQKQVAKAGVATKEEVDALKRRIRELESRSRQGTTSSKPAARTGSASKPTGAKRATGTRKAQTTGATRIPRGGTATRTSPPGTRGG